MQHQLSNRVWLASALSEAGVSSDALSDAIARAETIATAAINLSAGDERASIEVFAQRIDLSEGRIDIILNLASLLEGDAEQAVFAPPISVPTTLQCQGRNRPIVVHAETGAPRRDVDLIALVADARRWMDDILEGQAAFVAAITQREGFRPGTVCRILPLAWLAPDIAAAILEGRQPIALTAKKPRALPDIPLDWSDQPRVLRFPPT